MYLRMCQYPSDFISCGYRGEFLQIRHGERLKKFIMVDGEVRTHDPKNHGLLTSPFVKELVGY